MLVLQGGIREEAVVPGSVHGVLDALENMFVHDVVDIDKVRGFIFAMRQMISSSDEKHLRQPSSFFH